MSAEHSAAVAYVLINCDIGKEKEVLEELKKIPGVIEAHLLYGVYDIIVKATGKNNTEIREMILTKIRRIPGVKRTLTMPVVE
ncbi:MAG: Lrp/AsnC ligand binding domain-containing protein [Thermofilum sp.]|jgi:DNA-binding Lrp family transcriptional regulator|uniref:AsnC family transcriptional regulator n=2 Tax=Thermofilum adornatum TaxID=1365176 RepID=S5ZKI9_9CREN|nr:Lrp/AsnC ligand binding domain-containing protein [Thermofilum adornatum]AGT35056.1 AsnC family transcriptional regulator [Thermofilum adornatum]AJB42789.1 Transcriptional regulator, AsnC family [Thermofilum adornatum 1505]